MTDVLVDRAFSPARDRNGVYEIAREADSCFDLYRVNWHGSMLTNQGARAKTTRERDSSWVLKSPRVSVLDSWSKLYL